MESGASTTVRGCSSVPPDRLTAAWQSAPSCRGRAVFRFLTTLINDDVAAAVVNPGISAWGALAWRAQLAAGETVLILGATGVTGKLAIQTAKLLGAGRVIAAGRNEQVLKTLHALGADTTIHLDKPGQDLTEAFVREAGESGFDVIIDYLWGPTTEALLAAIARRDLQPASPRVRLVEVGESAGPTISLAAAVLRSSRLEILGAGSGNAAASPEIWIEAARQLMSNIGCGKLRIETERVPLGEVENAWHQEQHAESGHHPVVARAQPANRCVATRISLGPRWVRRFRVYCRLTIPYLVTSELARHSVADEVAGRRLRRRGHVPQFRGGSVARRRRAAS